MQVTTWFQAKEDEAQAIASEESDLEDWPHLDMPLIAMEFMALSSALRGTEDITDESPNEGPPLVEEEGLFVLRVKEAFIHALAGLGDADLPRMAEAWVERIDREHHELEELREILTDMVRFAREAVARRSPVLELSTF